MSLRLHNFQRYGQNLFYHYIYYQIIFTYVSKKADLTKAMLDNKYVIVLYLNVLPNLAEDTFENYVSIENEEQLLWYNSKDIVGQIRKSIAYIFILQSS